MVGSFSFPSLKKKTPKTATKIAEVKITDEISLKERRLKDEETHIWKGNNSARSISESRRVGSGGR